jgi:secondary thiamine-phosphate synthase enzyme
MTETVIAIEPLAGSTIAAHHLLRFRTGGALEFIDLTDEIASLVARAGVRFGMANIQTLHTTGMIVVNEHEPLLLEDMRCLLERLAPCDEDYRHDDFARRTVNLNPQERANGHSHCKALFLRTSECLNIVDGRLQLGRWQRIFFLELDGELERAVSVMIIGQGAERR